MTTNLEYTVYYTSDAKNIRSSPLCQYCKEDVAVMTTTNHNEKKNVINYIPPCMTITVKEYPLYSNEEQTEKIGSKMSFAQYIKKPTGLYSSLNHHVFLFHNMEGVMEIETNEYDIDISLNNCFQNIGVTDLSSNVIGYLGTQISGPNIGKQYEIKWYLYPEFKRKIEFYSLPR